MQEYDWTMFQAMSFVKDRRGIIHPNPGFQRQLLDFEKKLLQNRRATATIASTISKGALSSMQQTTSWQSLVSKRRSEANRSSVSTSAPQKPKYKNIREAFADFQARKVVKTEQKRDASAGRGDSTGVPPTMPGASSVERQSAVPFRSNSSSMLIERPHSPSNLRHSAEKIQTQQPTTRKSKILR